MMGKKQILENVPLLASMGEEILQNLAERAEFLILKKDDLVVKEGDPGDGFYVVASGRLQAFTQLKNRGERVYVRYGSGDWFGEMPLLSGETHWASVRALNDSVLLKIPRAAFESMLQLDSRAALAFTQRMGERMKQLREDKIRAKWSTIITLCSAVPSSGKSLLAANLVASLAWETREPVVLLDFSGMPGSRSLARGKMLAIAKSSELEHLLIHHPLGYDQLNLQLTGDERELHFIAPFFAGLSKRYKYVLVDLPNQVCPTVFECLLQSDHIYVVTKNEDEHLVKTRRLLQDLKNHQQPVAPKARIILTAVGSSSVPLVETAQAKLGQEISYLLRWIPEDEIVESVDGVPFVLRQPRSPFSMAIRRMAREMGNVLVGLALGAGAARGLAHIGVIRVLEREGIHIDVVAGSSMGALVSAIWATGRTADELEHIALSVKNKWVFLRLLDPMFPGAGLLRGIGVYNFLDSIVDGLTFDDTLFPVKIVASDMNSIEEVTLERGKLIDAVRASISIPGIFRPVQHQGRTLIDGGLASPVPVDALVRSGVSKIIAVNALPNIEMLKEQRLAEAEKRRHASYRKQPMHETGAFIDTPTSIIKVYMRLLQATQSRISQDACSKADVVLTPVVPDGVWYDFYHPERYIRCGEQAAEAALAQIKELAGPRPLQ